MRWFKVKFCGKPLSKVHHTQLMTTSITRRQKQFLQGKYIARQSHRSKVHHTRLMMTSHQKHSWNRCTIIFLSMYTHQYRFFLVCAIRGASKDQSIQVNAWVHVVSKRSSSTCSCEDSMTKSNFITLLLRKRAKSTQTFKPEIEDTSNQFSQDYSQDLRTWNNSAKRLLAKS